MAPRKAISRHTRMDVLMEAGYRCGNPACGHVLTLDIHHMEWVKDGGGDEASNLLALCPNCHSLHNSGHIPPEAIRHWKGMLVSLNHAFDRRAMDLLWFLRQNRGEGYWFSTDTIVEFIGLLAAGLVEFTTKNMTMDMACISQHRFYLTTRGEMLVDAWLAGDEKAYISMLSQGAESSEGGADDDTRS